jgi:hypothetical protein
VSFLAGENLTAGRLNRLQPTTYNAGASGTVPASSTNVDVPGATVTFTTVVANAVAHCYWTTDFDLSGPTTALGTSRLLLDGATASTKTTVFEAEVATDRASVAQMDQYTIATPGSHTIKMQATTPASMTIGLQSALRVVVVEVV